MNPEITNNPNQTGQTSAQVVESPKNAKNENLPLIIILAILAVAGIGFGGFELWQNMQKNNEIKDLQAEVADLSQVNNEKIDNEESADKNQYASYLNNLSKNYKGGIFGYYYHYTGSDNVMRTVSAHIDGTNLKIEDIDGSRGVVFEKEGYVSVYYAKTGNGGVPHFYLISTDGTVSRIDIAEDGNYKPRELAEYKNIVSVFEGSDLYAWLVDIDGNIYKDAGN